MPNMSALEATFCRSAPWRLIARKVVPWATQGVALTGDVLEIGGGTGAMAEEIAREFPQARIVTTDFDPAMVDVAKARLAGAPTIDARQADATELPFADDSFDVAASFLMLHHVIDWEQAIMEIGRVLRPGGAFVGYDLTASLPAKWIHVVDRSPHRLIGRGEIEPVLAHAGLDVANLRYGFGGTVVRFVARTPTVRTHGE